MNQSDTLRILFSVTEYRDAVVLMRTSHAASRSHPPVDVIVANSTHQWFVHMSSIHMGVADNNDRMICDGVMFSRENSKGVISHWKFGVPMGVRMHIGYSGGYQFTYRRGSAYIAGGEYYPVSDRFGFGYITSVPGERIVPYGVTGVDNIESAIRLIQKKESDRAARRPGRPRHHKN